MKKLFIILHIFICLTILAVNIVNGQTPPPPNFAPNQLIVKYKPGQSPEELKAQVTQRTNLRQTPLLGPIMLFFANIKFSLTGQDSPEKKLAKLDSAALEIGVIESQNLFADSQDTTLKNFYLLKTNGKMEIMQAIELYKKLPEVESAEPNYMYSTMGI